LFVHLDSDLSGEQFRTISCNWGNKSCFGYSNPLEIQDFCDGPEIHFHMCPLTFKYKSPQIMPEFNRTFG
jgi:hypothetical protein